MKVSHCWLGLWVPVIVSSCMVGGDRALAQITPDGTLGAEGSRVVQDVLIRGALSDRIEGGAARGVNLFHSFEAFNVGDGERVYFDNPAAIENIFSRVTGNNPSNIMGLLGVDGSANLYLLNPNGILFGPNARLDISGSFLATTADRFIFPNGEAFSAIDPQAAPLLTVNVPIGLQYGASPRGNIINDGSLILNPGQSLTLLGNTVIHRGILSTAGGTIHLLGNQVALLETAQIDVASPTGGGTVLIGGDLQGSGDIPTATRILVAPETAIHADALSDGDGGRIIIWANEATHFYGNVSARGGMLSGNGGLVEISGRDWLIFNGQVDTTAPQGSRGTLLLDPTNIEVVDFLEAETFDLNDVNEFLDPDINADGDTKIDSFSLSFAATNIELQATNNIIFNAFIFPRVGLLAIAGNDIIVNDSIFSLSGGIQFNASRDILINGTINLFDGGIQFNAGNVISIDSPVGTFDGNIQLNADNSISIYGAVTTRDGNIEFRAVNDILIDDPIFAFSDGSIYFNAGTNILINDAINTRVDSIQLDADNDIVINPFPNNTSLSSRGGLIANAGNDLMLNNAILTLSSDLELSADGDILISGYLNGIATDGGNLEFNVGNTLHITNEALIDTTAIFGDNSGNIQIQTGSLLVDGGAQILAAPSSSDNPGSISINATEEINISGELSLRGWVSTISTTVISPISNRQGFPATAGNIEIQGQSLSLTDGAQIGSGLDDYSFGSSGNIRIITTDFIRLDGANSAGYSSGLFSNSDPGAEGSSGNIFIRTDRLQIANGAVVNTLTRSSEDAGDITIEAAIVEVIDGGQILSVTRSSGEAGDISIVATDQVRLSGFDPDFETRFANFGAAIVDNVGSSSGVFLNVEPNATGNGGNLFLITNGLYLNENAIISASTRGEGRAGNIEFETGILRLSRSDITVSGAGSSRAGDLTIRADAINLDNRSAIAAETEVGEGGNIRLRNLGSLSLRENSRLSTSTVSGIAGNILIQVQNNLQLDQRATISASTQGGQGGNILIEGIQENPVEQVSLERGSQITATATGIGSAGDIRIRADNLQLSRSNIIVSGTGSSRAGDLTIQADTIELERGSSIAAETARGRGGNVTLSGADSLSLMGGSSISTSTRQGRGGNLSVLMAPNGDIELSGESRIAAEVTRRRATATGTIPIAGNLTIQTDELMVQERSQVTVSALTGQAGSLRVSARDIQLNNGQIIAETGFSPDNGQGANIQLQDLDRLLITNGSLISARALGDADGGNVTIEAADGFIIAIPFENNDIIATAERGTGGNIDVRALRLFGFSDLSTERLSFEQLRANDTSDISASSEFGAQGAISFDILTIDPSQGLTELPEGVVDASQQITRRCGPGSGITEEELGSFIITGRGGIPANPDDLQSNEIDLTELMHLESDAPPEAIAPIEQSQVDDAPIVEAQGWVIGANGEIQLTAEAATPATHRAIAPAATCIVGE